MTARQLDILQHSTIDYESRVADWVNTRIGPAHMHRRERAMRLLEEALELAQSEGITEPQALAQIVYTFNRIPGEAFQEAGGVAACLLGWCASVGITLQEVAEAELKRMEAKPLEEIRASLARKNDADLVTVVEA